MKPVVMVAYGGGHVAMLAPVARVLIERGTALLFLAMTTAGAYLERLGLPYIGYQNLPGAQDEQVQAWGRELARDLPANSVVPLQESIAYLGLNYQDLVNRLGVEGAKQAYTEQGRQAFLPETLFKCWFTQIDPRVVVTTNSPRSERAALTAAHELNIPTVCVVDWNQFPAYSADRICVLNEQIRTKFIRKGCPPEKLVVTGNPAFERLQHPAIRVAGRDMRTTKGWANHEKVILFASQAEPAMHPHDKNLIADPLLPRKIETYLREFVAKSTGFRLVVRYHPSEQGVIFQNGQKHVEESVSSEDLAVLLNAIDLVVVMTSTVGIEGYLAGKYVISVRGSVSDKDRPYYEMGIAAETCELSRLSNAILNSRTGIEQKTNLERVFEQAPTQKIVEVIDGVLTNL